MKAWVQTFPCAGDNVDRMVNEVLDELIGAKYGQK
jgi:hypothetical protein